MTVRWRLLVYACVSRNIVEDVWEALSRLAAAETSPLVSTTVLVDMPRSKQHLEGLSAIGDLEPFTHAKTVRHSAPGRLEEMADGPQGELRTGTPETLVRFLEWGLRGRTDERVALILLGHGQAWQGLGRDEVAGPTGGAVIETLLPAQIDGALEQILHSRAKGKPQLDLLGFCSCNMASLEVMAWLHPHAQMIIASQDVIYTSNWDLAAVVGTLVRKHDSASEVVGSSILDACLCFNGHVFEKPEDHPKRGILSVLTLIRTSEVPALLLATSRVAQRLASAFTPSPSLGSAASALRAAREECDEFNSPCWGGGRGKCGAEARSAAQVDVRQFLRRLTEAGRLDSLNDKQRDALQQLEDAFGRAIVKMTENPYLEQVGGLGVYFPGRRGVYAPTLYRQSQFPGLGDWGRFVLDQWIPGTEEESSSSILKKNEGQTKVLDGFTSSYHPAIAEDPQQTLAEERPLFGFRFGLRTLGVIPGHPFFKKELTDVYVPPWHRGDWHALDVGGGYRFIPIVGAGLNRRGRTRFWVETDAFLQREGWAERRPIVLGFHLDLYDKGEFAYAGMLVETVGGGLTRLPIRLRQRDLISFAAYVIQPNGLVPGQFTSVPLGTPTGEPPHPGLSLEPMQVSDRGAIRVVRQKLPQPSAVILGLERWRGSRVLLEAPVA